MKLNEIMICTANHALAYTERLLVGIPQEKFARFAFAGAEPIRSNHPSFILGHLSLYGPRILNDLNFAAGKTLIAPEFEAIYSKDAQCMDDPDGSIYPPMERVVETYFNAYRQTLELIKNVPDSDYDRPNPNQGAIARFPTMGAMHVFYLGGHLMLHLGQLSAWRRVVGLPPA
jgi:hypothetical protein